jgi:hypothetical protein
MSLKSKKDNFFDIKDAMKDNTNDTNKTYGYSLFMIILGLVIYFFILNWLTKVHKCKCAIIPESLYLKEWFSFTIIYLIIILLYLLFNGSYNNSGILLYLSMIIGIINFIMIIRLLIYIHKLKEIKCDCGLTMQENIIYYYFIIIFSIIIFSIILSLLFSIISFMNK